MIKRLLYWALDIYSPSLAMAGKPSFYTFRGAIRGERDRCAYRDGTRPFEARAYDFAVEYTGAFADAWGKGRKP